MRQLFKKFIVYGGDMIERWDDWAMGWLSNGMIEQWDDWAGAMIEQGYDGAMAMMER